MKKSERSSNLSSILKNAKPDHYLDHLRKRNFEKKIMFMEFLLLWIYEFLRWMQFDKAQKGNKCLTFVLCLLQFLPYWQNLINLRTLKILYITSKGNIGLNLPNFAATKVKFEYFFYNLTLKKLLDLDLFSCPNSYFMSSTMWWYSVKICQYSMSQDIWEDIHRFFSSHSRTPNTHDNKIIKQNHLITILNAKICQIFYHFWKRTVGYSSIIHMYLSVMMNLVFNRIQFFSPWKQKIRWTKNQFG